MRCWVRTVTFMKWKSLLLRDKWSQYNIIKTWTVKCIVLNVAYISNLVHKVRSKWNNWKTNIELVGHIKMYESVSCKHIFWRQKSNIILYLHINHCFGMYTYLKSWIIRSLQEEKSLNEIRIMIILITYIVRESTSYVCGAQFDPGAWQWINVFAKSSNVTSRFLEEFAHSMVLYVVLLKRFGRATSCLICQGHDVIYILGKTV